MTNVDTQNNAANQASAPPPPYGSMNQVSSGPAGELYTLSNELIHIYNELQKLYNEMTVAETNVQQNTINAGADAQRSAALNQAIGIGCEAAGSLVSAGVTAGFTFFGEKPDNAANIKDLETNESNLKQLNDLSDKADSIFATKGDPNYVLGDTVPSGEDVQSRIRQLQANPTDLQDSTLDKCAIRGMEDEDYATFKGKLQDRINSQEKVVSTSQGKINNVQSSYQQRTSMATNAANILANGGKAVFTGLQGQSQAAAQVSEGVTRMASSTADSTRQGIAQDYAKVSDVIASARAGAQAYAQT